MTIRYLNKMFYPRSVAVIGATNEDGATGNVAMHNLLQGGFEGAIMPVSPAVPSVAGVLADPRIDALPMIPDLAVIAADAGEVLEAIDALGVLGTRAAVVLSPSQGPASEQPGRLSHTEMARFTQIDYDREMAFIASAPNEAGDG